MTSSQDHPEAVRALVEALSFAEQALTVAAGRMSSDEDRRLYNRALRTARSTLARYSGESK